MLVSLGLDGMLPGTASIRARSRHKLGPITASWWWAAYGLSMGGRGRSSNGPLMIATASNPCLLVASRICPVQRPRAAAGDEPDLSLVARMLQGVSIAFRAPVPARSR